MAQHSSSHGSSNTNPSIIGPGYWSIYHRKARQAQSSKLEEEFIEFDAWLCNNFPCMNCRRDSQEYSKANDIKRYRNIKDKKGNYIGLSQYAWARHNAVNAKLGKATINFETCWKLYSDEEGGSGVCTSDCGEVTNHSPAPPQGNPSTVHGNPSVSHGNLSVAPSRTTQQPRPSGIVNWMQH